MTSEPSNTTSKPIQQPTLDDLTGPVLTVPNQTGPQPTLEQLTSPVPTAPQPTGPVPTLDQLTGPTPTVARAQATMAEMTGPVPTVSEPTSPNLDRIPSESGQQEPEPQPQLNPHSFRQGDELILVDGALPSSDFCVKTGKKPKATLSAHLRSPFQPLTWFSSQSIPIGLSKQALENYRISQALYWALIIMGAIMIAVGFKAGWSTSAAGILVCLAGLVVRSLFPVWSPSTRSNEWKVRGCGTGYLAHYAEKDRG